MTVLVYESKARCLENRRLLADSRLIIDRSRRLLNPAQNISGASDGLDLHVTVRTPCERLALSSTLQGLGGKGSRARLHNLRDQHRSLRSRERSCRTYHGLVALAVLLDLAPRITDLRTGKRYGRDRPRQSPSDRAQPICEWNTTRAAARQVMDWPRGE